MRRNNPALNSTVIGLGLVSLFADISSEMLYPSLLKTYSGYWSDRIQKRKIFISIGYFLSAVAKPVMASTVAGLLWDHAVKPLLSTMGQQARR